MTKKELKESYKNMKFKMGVFQLRNRVNGKIFIESSLNLDAIWNRHRLELNYGSHRNKMLQNDWNSMGSDSFVFEIIGQLEEQSDKKVDYQKEIKIFEQLYIDDLQPFDEKGYHQKPK
jgi:hypothetical protein